MSRACDGPISDTLCYPVTKYVYFFSFSWLYINPNPSYSISKKKTYRIIPRPSWSSHFTGCRHYSNNQKFYLMQQQSRKRLFIQLGRISLYSTLYRRSFRTKHQSFDLCWQLWLDLQSCWEWSVDVGSWMVWTWRIFYSVVEGLENWWEIGGDDA